MPAKAAPKKDVLEPKLYRDPPNIVWGRGIPPESEWPGRRTNEEDVAAACGDGRDWFRYWHRLEKHRELWASYDRRRQGKKDDHYYRGFKWNQRLIIGMYGVGKTTIAVANGLSRLQRGFPFFHNGSGLVGWVLFGDEIFTAMAIIPPCSVLLFDEAHTTLPGRLGGSTAVSVCQSLGANIRKINCQWDIVSAQHNTVHQMIRADCVEVLRPFKPDIDTGGTRRPTGLQTWNDNRNFILAWDVWEGTPFADPEVRRWGMDTKPADYWALLSGEAARNAFLMTDSFQRIDAGNAVLADKENIKDSLRRLRGQAESDARSPQQAAVLEVVASIVESNTNEPYVTAGQISQATGFNSASVGRIVNEMFGVSNTRGKGYSIDDLVNAYYEYQEP